VERKIYDALDQDVQETWAVTGVYPDMAWTPDGKSVVFWAGGKLRRVDGDGRNAREIPFRINDSRGVIDGPHPQVTVSPDSVTTNMVRFTSVSPDGRSVVFESLGKLYVRAVAGGTPKRLTNGGDFELFPSWSRDGKSLVFVNWSDSGLGSIRIVGASGGAARTITSDPGHYARPRFSPDGATIVFERSDGGGVTSPLWSETAGAWRIAAAGGTAVRLVAGGSEPHFGASNDRVFMTVSGGGKRQLVSTDRNGEARRVHAEGDLVTAYQVAPDGSALAFRQNYEAFVMPLLPGAQAVSVDAKGGALPVTKVSSGGADFLGWSQGGAALNWSLGPVLYSVAAPGLSGSAPAAEGAAKFVPPSSGVSLAMPVAADRPHGVIALVGARLVTMAAADGGIIDDGIVVVTDNRITAIGKRGAVAVPAGAKIVDVGGKTIIPGLIDAHAHGPAGTDELVPQQNWSMLQNLALGTTTIHNPSSRAAEIFAAAEMQRAGIIIAPRIFSTGEIIYGAKAPDVFAQIDGYDDALAHVRRLKAQGAGSVKNYNQPRRDQRQQVTAAARAEGMQVVAEGGSLFGLDMTHIADGNSTLEHNIPLGVFYKDVVDFFAASKTNYTPTLVVSFGGPAGDPYWRQATDIFAHPLLQAHSPPAELAAEGARRVKAPEADYIDDDNAREAAKLARRGVKVSIGAHGQQAGIGSHWELWSFVRGGMSPLEALAAGTIAPAQSLGMAGDIGSLEVGKLADLVVLDADPTVDIRNSDKIYRVMLGGRLYDPVTMNELVSGNRQRLPYWWEAK
jgi:imidazolonepropionase-like amidohydrolase